MNVVPAVEVMAGAWSTVSMNVCVAFGLSPVAGRDGDRVGSAGPRRRRPGQGGRAVTVVGERHAGRQSPVFDQGGVGLPVVVTVKVPEDPTVKVVLLDEVIAGAASTVRVKDWVPFGLIPLLAVMVIG